jgi:uncharacterized surface protein with fasciclin (FAS1) repeats
MKRVSIIKSTMILAFVAFLGSCSKEESQNEPQTQNVSVEEATHSETDLSFFREAIKITNFEAEMNQSQNQKISFGYTFFAPTNEAFKAFLKDNGFTSISQVPKNVLANVLSNHLVKGKNKAADLKTGYLKTFAKGEASSKNTLSLYVNTKEGVKLNGVSKVIKADIVFGFSVVHMVDKVIPLPTIVTHALANESFTSLVGALTSDGQPDFVSVLSGKGKFTVFAPTNGAFTSLDTELAPGGIASVSTANLTKVLQYHVVGGANVIAASLTNNQVVTPILTPAQTFTVQLPSSGPQIKDAAGRISKIIATDVQCTNGVVHVLDKVLLPKL